MSSDIKRLLKGFTALCKAHPGAIPDSVTFGEDGGDHHYFTFCLHGNEIGSFPGVLRAAADILSGKLKVQGKATFTLGNREAVEQGVRFINSDMNRCFKPGLYFNSEENRASEILSDLASVTHLVDFHQTIGVTPGPFYIYAHDKNSRLFAHRLGVAERGIVLGQGSENLDSTLVAAGTRLEIPSVTLELSQFGLVQEAEDLCYEVISHVLSNSATEKKEVKEYAFVEFIPLNDPEDHLSTEFKNFDSVTKGEILGHRKNGENIVSSQDGVIIFPRSKIENEVTAESAAPENIAVIASEVDLSDLD